MPVKFCITAPNDQDANEIFQNAQPVAAINSYDRHILKKGEAGFPGDQTIQAAAASAGVTDPGAVILDASDSPSGALSVSDAKNPAMIEYAFTQAGA